ncbi:MAG: tetratricopeptide repeat protein [Brevinematales bacterium]|nr:tetratricopeptide repeat protein [Brevinematales bacterium]
MVVTKTDKVKLLAYYKKGLELYKSMKFSEALDYFKECLKIDPKDGPSKVYVERCNEYIQNPPPNDWDGVYEMKTK